MATDVRSLCQAGAHPRRHIARLSSALPGRLALLLVSLLPLVVRGRATRTLPDMIWQPSARWWDSLNASFTARNRHPREWAGCFNESSSHANTERLLWAARHRGKNVTISLTGGSSSARINGFAWAFGRTLATALSHNGSLPTCTFEALTKIWLCSVGGRSDQVVEIVAAANGHTGTDFSAILFDALVPRRTDILIWEYVINDWKPLESNPKYLGNALDIYLRRAMALNPRMSFVFAYLWAPSARDCWPSCDSGRGQKFIWKAATELLAQYAHELDAVSIDFNSIAVLR